MMTVIIAVASLKAIIAFGKAMRAEATIPPFPSLGKGRGDGWPSRHQRRSCRSTLMAASPLCWTTKESQSSCDVFVPPAPHHPPLGGDGEQEGRTRSSDEPTLPLPALGGEGKGDRRQPDRQEPRRGQKMPFGPRLALGVGLGESTLCAGCLCPLWVHSHRLWPKSSSSAFWCQNTFGAGGLIVLVVSLGFTEHLGTKYFKPAKTPKDPCGTSDRRRSPRHRPSERGHHQLGARHAGGLAQRRSCHLRIGAMGLATPSPRDGLA